MTDQHNWFKNEEVARQQNVADEEADRKHYDLDDIGDLVDGLQRRKKRLREAQEADDAWNYRILQRVIHSLLKRLREQGYPSAFIVLLGEDEDDGGHILGIKCGQANEDATEDCIKIGNDFLAEVGVPKDYLTVFPAAPED